MKPLAIQKKKGMNRTNSSKFQKIFDNILKLQNEEYQIINKGVN